MLTTVYLFRTSRLYLGRIWPKNGRGDLIASHDEIMPFLPEQSTCRNHLGPSDFFLPVAIALLGAALQDPQDNPLHY